MICSTTKSHDTAVTYATKSHEQQWLLTTTQRWRNERGWEALMEHGEQRRYLKLVSERGWPWVWGTWRKTSICNSESIRGHDEHENGETREMLINAVKCEECHRRTVVGSFWVSRQQTFGPKMRPAKNSILTYKARWHYWMNVHRATYQIFCKQNRRADNNKLFTYKNVWLCISIYDCLWTHTNLLRSINYVWTT